MMRHLEGRFSAICAESGVSFTPTIEVRTLALDLGVSSGHCEVAVHHQLYSTPPAIHYFGRHTTEHFDYECRKAARQVAREQARQSVIYPSVAGFFNTWTGTVHPFTHLAPSPSLPSSLSTSTDQLSHEGCTSSSHTTSSSRRTTARASWISTPSYNLEQTSFESGTFPPQAFRSHSTNPFPADEEISYFNEHPGSSEGGHIQPAQEEDRGRRWGSLRGWRGRR